MKKDYNKIKRDQTLIVRFMLGYVKSTETHEMPHGSRGDVIIEKWELPQGLPIGIDRELVEIGIFHYDSSWDWLMPVIKKCYSGPNDKMSELREKFDFWEMDKMFDAVVEYIKWYNEFSNE